MKNEEIYIIGVGPYSIVMAELAELCGYVVGGYYHYNDDRTGELYYGKEIISSVSDLLDNNIEGKKFILSMGNNNIRTELSIKLRNKKAIVPSIIHPTVEVSKTAEIGIGVILKRNVTIQSDCKINDDCIICDNTTVCHHSHISSGSFIAGSCVLGAYTKVLEKAFIGQGSIIPSGKVQYIGNNSVIGAGSVVLKDVLDYEVVAGNPAKHLKFIKPTTK